MQDQNIKQIQIVDFDKLSNLQLAYKILKAYANDEAEVTYRLNHTKVYPFNTVASITVSGNRIVFLDCERLLIASKLADNISFYPLDNGDVEFILTFNGSMMTLG